MREKLTNTINKVAFNLTANTTTTLQEKKMNKVYQF